MHMTPLKIERCFAFKMSHIDDRFFPFDAFPRLLANQLRIQQKNRKSFRRDGTFRTIHVNLHDDA